jgi:leader peptidase (prepilin peptidase)/N-methyltransferase
MDRAFLQVNDLIPLLVAPAMGSFAESLAGRVPSGRPIVMARSQCESCRAVLRPLELIPLASWIALNGKCSRCGAKISLTHPIAELAALVVGVWAVLVVDGWIVWPSLFLGWSLLALVLMDLRYLVLADIIVLPVLAVGIATSFAISEAQGIAALAGAALGGGTSLAIRESYRWLRGREGLGFGDVKLLAASGAWVAWKGLPSVVLIASVLALVVMLPIVWGQGSRRTGELRVPFGAFIAVGLWIVWLHGPITFDL